MIEQGRSYEMPPMRQRDDVVVFHHLMKFKVFQTSQPIRLYRPFDTVIISWNPDLSSENSTEFQVRTMDATEKVSPWITTSELKDGKLKQVRKQKHEYIQSKIVTSVVISL